MRKITVVFVVLAIVALFVSCGDNGNQQTTNQPIQTGIPPYQSSDDTSSESQSESSSSGGDNSVQPVTYILTTSPDKTAPWSDTTRFEIDSVQLPPSNSAPFSDPNFSVGQIDRPSVNSSQASSNNSTPSQSNSGPTQSQSQSQSQSKSDKPTAPTKKTPKAVDVNSFSYNSDAGTISLSVSLDGWNGNFATNSQNISILVDGEKIGTTVPCKVTSKVDADGCQIVTIDVSSLSISSGSNITYTIPAGLLVTKTGSQYNTSYTGSAPIY